MRTVWSHPGACVFGVVLMTVVCCGRSGSGAPAGNTPPDAQRQSFCVAIAIPIARASSPLRVAQSSEPFRFKPTFAADVTAAQRVVLQHALDEWQEIIRTRGFAAGPYPVQLSFGPLAPGVNGVAMTGYIIPTGDLIGAEIVFASSESLHWFVDATPEDDTEFNGTPPGGTDLLTVARHEIGHAVGWCTSPLVISHLSAGTFDRACLNIATFGPGNQVHADPAVYRDDLMLPGLGTSERRPIRLYPDAALPARAFHYDIPMGFVYGTAAAGGLGSASVPWATLTEAFSWLPWDFHNLLMIPGPYREPVPFVLDQPMVITAARGGEVVLTGP